MKSTENLLVLTLVLHALECNILIKSTLAALRGIGVTLNTKAGDVPNYIHF